MTKKAMHQATLHSLYQYATGGFKVPHDADISLSVMSAHMAMNNVMFYSSTQLADALNVASNIAFSERMVNVFDALIGSDPSPKSDVPGITLPSVQLMVHSMMRTMWFDIFSPHYFWPEYARSPFGLAHPLHVLRENEKIEYTGTRIGTFYGQTDFDVWEETWTFPMPEIARSVYTKNDMFAHTLERQKNLAYARISTNEKYQLDTKYLEFFDTMRFLMSQLSGYMYFPITWPQEIFVYVDMEERPVPDTYPDNVSVANMLRLLGVFPKVEALSREIDQLRTALQDAIERHWPNIRHRDNAREILRGSLTRALQDELGVSEVTETGKRNTIDDENRFHIVNSGLTVIRAMFQSYHNNQAG